jgi:type I site-specific restriction endonuclease
MFEQTFKNIDDILHKDAGCTSELDYTEQSSWLLFLKYLDALEAEKATEAVLEGRDYPPDFFDFIIIDECHRGGANDESSWRAILEYFSPAVQLGLTASLLLIIEECALRLKSCALIVAELETQRKKETEDGVRDAVMATARECWLGFYEATDLEFKLCKSGIADEQPYSFDNFDSSRKHLDEIRAEFIEERRKQKPL